MRSMRALRATRARELAVAECILELLIRFSEPCGHSGLQPSPKHLGGGLLLDSVNIRKLRDFIEALDRRLPQVQRAGEAAIARDAVTLRARALEQIAELEQEPSHCRIGAGG